MDIKLENDLNIFNHNISFVMGVTDMKYAPDVGYPEIGFWGRSNVGKSSLINAIFNRKKLVKVSNTPGRTREVNYFNLADRLHFVDLPGYGYAKVAKHTKALWSDLVVDYVKSSKNLRRIYLLIDSRVGLKKIDLEIMSFLNHYGRSYQIIITKTDKVKASELDIVAKNIAIEIALNPACYPHFICTSSKNKIGIDEIKVSILNFL